MRVLNDDSRPTAVGVDASAAPLLVTPAMVTEALQPGAGRTDASFDADMAVILAALLCVLVGALGLGSLVRCFLRRCGRRATLTVATAAAATAALPAVPAADTTCGLKKKRAPAELASKIPVVVYDAAKAGVTATDCAICLAEFDAGEKLRVLPWCCHRFHVQCVDVWLASHSSCPTCRNSLLVLEEGDDAGEET